MVVNRTFINCSKGLIFPTSIEIQWSVYLRACLHLIALLYSFVGMAIIAEVFMCAIERITSSTRKVLIVSGKRFQNKPVQQYKEVLIWNPTVANVSLMALGTSAPEILISVIEVLGHNFKAGDLGPGTIVGSAAFNLMVITAICIAAVPNGEKKTITNISVYCVTAFWNIFAYVWLLFILMGPSKDQVEVWEGALTFIFFFILIISAYITDTKLYRRCFKKSSTTQCFVPQNVVEMTIDPNLTPNETFPDTFLESSGSVSHPEWHRLEQEASLEFPNMSDEELANVVALKINAQRPKDYLEHRIDAIRRFSKSSSTLSDLMENEKLDKDRKLKTSVVEFSARVYGVWEENQKEVVLKVVRRGPNEKRISFKYETVNGLAKSQIHFVPKSGTVIFDSGEDEKFVTIELIEGTQWITDDVFMVTLNPDPLLKDRAKFGKCNQAEVIFVGNKNKPNSTTVSFIVGMEHQSITTEVEFVSYCVNLKFRDGHVRVPVVRKGKLDQQIGIDWITEGIKSDGGSDSNMTMGSVTFEEGEIETYFDIPIDNNMSIENNKFCLVRLINPSAKVIIGQRSVCVISNDGNKFFSKIDTMVPRILRTLKPWNQSWQEQFYHHIYVNGGHTRSATVCDYILHIIAFPWKFICAFVPPATYLGGWLTFTLSLVLISVVTTLCLDFANTFGCLVGLDNMITAITFVAVGSSLPDTFASRIAAIKDKSADNAVGNVTGSNSVNVFIGLGFPWLVASIYWSIQGKPFYVPAGDISFCVTIYCIFSVVTIGLLFARRYMKFFGNAELGGTTSIKWTCAIILIFVWLLYVLLSFLHVYDYIKVGF